MIPHLYQNIHKIALEKERVFDYNIIYKGDWEDDKDNFPCRC